MFPNGPQWNSKNGYLKPARKRGNLIVITEAHVSRINFEGRRATRVSYSKDGYAQEVSAAKEVLLCAGAIGSPHILMLSGIGPADHLREHGIEVFENLPAVGQNLADHLRTAFEALSPEGVGTTVYADPCDAAQLQERRAYGHIHAASVGRCHEFRDRSTYPVLRRIHLSPRWYRAHGRWGRRNRSS